MKMKLGMEGNPDHENLALLLNLAVAGQLRQSLTESGLDSSEVWPIVESAVFDLAMIFDSGTIKVNGKVFRPRVAFVAEDGNILPGAAEFNSLHDYATVFEEDLAETNSFSLRF